MTFIDPLESVKKAADKAKAVASSAAHKVSEGASAAVKEVGRGAAGVTTGASSAASGVTKGASKALTSTSKALLLTGTGRNDPNNNNNNTSSSSSTRTAAPLSTNERSVGGTTTTTTTTDIAKALQEHRVVSAAAKDLDFYRPTGNIAVKTDYILHVIVKDNKKKDTTTTTTTTLLSKTYHDFRQLTDDLCQAAEALMTKNTAADNTKQMTQLVTYCSAANQLIESEQQAYLGKVSRNYVQTLAKRRSQVINDFLDETITNYPHHPDDTTRSKDPFVQTVAQLMETFFTTDQCERIEVDATNNSNHSIRSTVMDATHMKKKYQLVQRRGGKDTSTSKDSAEPSSSSTQESLIMDGEEQSKAKPAATKKIKPSLGETIGTALESHPIMVLAIFAGGMQVVRAIYTIPVTLNLDTILLVGFTLFVVGIQAPKWLGLPSSTTTASKKKKKSAMAAAKTGDASGGDDDDDDAPAAVVESPMPRFPEGAALGSILHCWSDPPNENFSVRGAKYLKDKKKIQSGPFLFPSRGLDLFLTDQCPENVGRISSLMGGELRSVPTFIINFRLPWGVLLFYSEIPERFLPFIKSCYDGDASSVDKADLEATMKEMTNSDRCCARFLLGDDDHKNKSLKIFPSVIEGPWVVKASVGGKPAIIGTKLPVNYVYEPEGEAIDGTKQALYLEADLDIVSNSTARGILSMVRSCTQDLTIDLGFGIQGNSDDELPEQMLIGTRIHGVDPLNAPALPPLKDTLFAAVDNDDDDSEAE